jgi:hypothetical protein
MAKRWCTCVNLVVPSLPDYGFSGKPERPLGPRRTARLWDRLLRDVLGYDTYIADGVRVSVPTGVANFPAASYAPDDPKPGRERFIQRAARSSGVRAFPRRRISGVRRHGLRR